MSAGLISKEPAVYTHTRQHAGAHTQTYAQTHAHTYAHTHAHSEARRFRHIHIQGNMLTSTQTHRRINAKTVTFM